MVLSKKSLMITIITMVLNDDAEILTFSEVQNEIIKGEHEVMSSEMKVIPI